MRTLGGSKGCGFDCRVGRKTRPLQAGLNWLSPRGQPLKPLILCAIGAVSALGQVPWGLWPLTVFGLVAAMVLTQGAASRRWAFMLGLGFGTGYFAVALHWIVEPFLVDVARHGWMAPFALVFMALGGGAFWGAGALVARSLGRGVVTPMGLALGLLLAEVARALVFTGFPWALIGHIWIGQEMFGVRVDQLAAWIGPHGLTALTVVFAALIANGRWIWALATGAVTAGGALAVYLPLVSGTLVSAPGGDAAPVVRIIQPNAAQHLKWAPGSSQMFFERQVAMTAAPGAPDLVVWPETSVTTSYLNDAQGAFAVVADASGGAPVILGGLRREGAGFFNSAVVVGADGLGHDSYDKSHLVPFGEYIPWVQTFAQLGLTFGLVEPGAGYSAGPGLHLLDVPGIGAVMPLICYEGIFAEEVNGVEGRARAIVLVTNDAWFGNWAGPEQHFAQARLRAIEQRLPVIRAANTGISGMIDARGAVVAQLALNTDGFVDVPLPAALAAPPYTRWGDLPVMILVILWGVGQIVASGRKGVDAAPAPS